MYIPFCIHHTLSHLDDGVAFVQDDMSDGRPSTSTTLSGSSLDDYIV